MTCGCCKLEEIQIGHFANMFAHLHGGMSNRMQSIRKLCAAQLTKHAGSASLQLHSDGPHPSPSMKHSVTDLVFFRQHGQPFNCDRMVQEALDGALTEKKEFVTICLPLWLTYMDMYAGCRKIRSIARTIRRYLLVTYCICWQWGLGK